MTRKIRPKIVSPLLTAVILGIGAAFLPMSSGSAQNAPVATSTVSLVENADRTASTYSREHAGIVVAVRLGTADSTPAPNVIERILRDEFSSAGVYDPITFFFDQNDVPGTAVAYYYSGYVDGPFSLGASREQAKTTSETYLFRKSKGLL